MRADVALQLETRMVFHCGLSQVCFVLKRSGEVQRFPIRARTAAARRQFYCANSSGAYRQDDHFFKNRLFQ